MIGPGHVPVGFDSKEEWIGKPISLL